MEWETRADCVDRNPELWDGDDEYKTKKAKAVCFRCPVKDHCFIDAMVNESPTEERFTVRGAHTASERAEAYPGWIHSQGRNIRLLKTMYKKNNTILGGRQERRLERARKARRILNPGVENYNLHIAVLNQVIQYPEDTAENLGRRMGRSVSWFNSALHEACEAAS